MAVNGDIVLKIRSRSDPFPLELSSTWMRTWSYTHKDTGQVDHRLKLVTALSLSEDTVSWLRHLCYSYFGAVR